MPEKGTRALRVLVVLLLAGAVVGVMVQTAGARMRQHVAECRARYAAARTPADSAKVDEMLLATPGGRVQLWRTCGQLRRSGRIQPDGAGS